MNFHLEIIIIISCETHWAFMGYLSSIIRGGKKKKKQQQQKNTRHLKKTKHPQDPKILTRGKHSSNYTKNFFTGFATMKFIVLCLGMSLWHSS
jgi:hypothetical protein